MKIFVLDDSGERQNVFLHFLSEGNQVFTAYSQQEAIKVLKKEKEFDIIFLDHDLGGGIYMESHEDNTGWWVAKYIAENGIKSKRIIIHTLNYPGAKNMQCLLPTAQHIPFTLLVEKFRYLVSSKSVVDWILQSWVV